MRTKRRSRRSGIMRATSAPHQDVVDAALHGMRRQTRPDSKQSKHTALEEPVGRSATGSRWSESA
jgi:hypothetical protein